MILFKQLFCRHNWGYPVFPNDRFHFRLNDKNDVTESYWTSDYKCSKCKRWKTMKKPTNQLKCEKPTKEGESYEI